ncbi:TonB-dependent receptor [Parahaliea maris]|uniref:TonB-dependent receptor n=1 Tax=Parahaliea maris TaxID=2716870 RepID=A0A5C9A9K1_9GAMM|nr:TonB-dependent receptor [Parahaliea maris]TXS95941.1 TonB-dependent receptor [Parahaliea maris]
MTGTARYFHPILSFSPLAIAIAADPVMAQQAAGPGADAGREPLLMEHVLVTAYRREMSADEVGGSVSVLTGAELARTGTDDLAGMLRQVPGVSLSQPLKNRSTINIRGLNTDIGETQLTQDPAALYINDMPVTGTYAELYQPDMSLYDVERVEFLRGPQGTFFGSGALAGAVRIVTHSPSLERMEGALRADYANGGDTGARSRFDGMANVPLIEDTLALRVVGSWREDDGWVENVQLGTDNRYEDSNLRATLLWQASERLSLELSAMRIDSDPQDADSWNPELGEYRRSSPIREGRQAEMDLYHLDIDWQLNETLRLQSLTSVRESEANWDAVLNNVPGFGALYTQSGPFANETLVQEVRLVSEGARLSWVSGVYYLDTQTDAPLNLYLEGLQALVNGILGPGVLADDLFVSGKTRHTFEEQAVYADATLHLSEQWSVTTGLRYFRTDSRYRQYAAQNFDFATFALQPTPDFSNDIDDSDWTWRAGLSWEPADDRHYYATASRGYRAAMTNPNYGPSFVNPDDIFIPEGYQSDQTLNLEVGAKLLWWDGRLQTNVAVYRTEWTDIQVDALRPSDQLNYIANAGDALAQGVELESRLVLPGGLGGRLALTWQDAEIEDTTPETSFYSGAVEGDALPGAADFLAAAGLVYEWSAFASSRFAARLDSQYVGESTNRFSNLSGQSLANPDKADNSSYTNVSASLSLATEHWTVTAYGENLTDNDKAILNLGNTRDNRLLTLRPRTVGLRFDLRL